MMQFEKKSSVKQSSAPAQQHQRIPQTREFPRMQDDPSEGVRTAQVERQEQRVDTLTAAEQGGFPVIMPARSTLAKQFSHNSGNKLSDKKRSKELKKVGSELYQKQELAKSADTTLNILYSKERENKKKLQEPLNKVADRQLRENLANLYDIGDSETFSRIAANFCSASDDNLLQGMTGIVEKFTELYSHLNQLNLNTDKDFVENMERVEQICRYSQVVSDLKEKYPDVFKKLPNLKKTKEILATTRPLTEYWHLQVKILRNPYYGEHQNNEIKDRFDAGDSDEAKELAVLLQQRYHVIESNKSLQKGELLLTQQPLQEARAVQDPWYKWPGKKMLVSGIKDKIQNALPKFFGKKNKGVLEKFQNMPAKIDKMDEQIQKLERSIEQAEEKLQKEQEKKKKKASATGREEAETTPLVQVQRPKFLQEKYREIAKIRKEKEALEQSSEYKVPQRLLGQNYRVAGAAEASSQPLFRHFADLQNLAAVQNMKKEDLGYMLENLASANQEGDRGSLLNREGLCQYKQMVKCQMEYLCRKFGRWMETATPDEILEQWSVIKRDFSTIEEMEAAFQYMRKLKNSPLDLLSEDDQHTMNRVTYFAAQYKAVKNALVRFSEQDDPNLAELQEGMLRWDLDALRAGRLEKRFGMTETLKPDLKYQSDYTKTDNDDLRMILAQRSAQALFTLHQQIGMDEAAKERGGKKSPAEAAAKKRVVSEYRHRVVERNAVEKTLEDRKQERTAKKQLQQNQESWLAAELDGPPINKVFDIVGNGALTNLGHIRGSGKAGSFNSKAGKQILNLEFMKYLSKEDETQYPELATASREYYEGVAAAQKIQEKKELSEEDQREYDEQKKKIESAKARLAKQQDEIDGLVSANDILICDRVCAEVQKFHEKYGMIPLNWTDTRYLAKLNGQESTKEDLAKMIRLRCLITGSTELKQKMEDENEWEYHTLMYVSYFAFIYLSYNGKIPSSKQGDNDSLMPCTMDAETEIFADYYYNAEAIVPEQGDSQDSEEIDRQSEIADALERKNDAEPAAALRKAGIPEEMMREVEERIRKSFAEYGNPQGASSSSSAVQTESLNPDTKRGIIESILEDYVYGDSRREEPTREEKQKIQEPSQRQESKEASAPSAASVEEITEEVPVPSAPSAASAVKEITEEVPEPSAPSAASAVEKITEEVPVPSAPLTASAMGMPEPSAPLLTASGFEPLSASAMGMPEPSAPLLTASGFEPLSASAMGMPEPSAPLLTASGFEPLSASAMGMPEPWVPPLTARGYEPTAPLLTKSGFEPLSESAMGMPEPSAAEKKAESDSKQDEK